MDDKQRQMWTEFVTTCLGERWVNHALTHPSSPTLSYQVGDVPLGDWLDQEERFLYSILPSAESYHHLLPSLNPLASILWDFWWGLVMTHHHIFGHVGVRRGWELVQPRYVDPVEELAKALKKTVAIGEFEFKQEGEEILPS